MPKAQIFAHLQNHLIEFLDSHYDDITQDYGSFELDLDSVALAMAKASIQIIEVLAEERRLND